MVRGGVQAPSALTPGRWGCQRREGPQYAGRTYRRDLDPTYTEIARQRVASAPFVEEMPAAIPGHHASMATSDLPTLHLEAESL